MDWDDLVVICVAVAVVLLFTGCASVREDWRALTCYQTQPFVDCKLTGER